MLPTEAARTLLQRDMLAVAEIPGSTSNLASKRRSGKCINVKALNTIGIPAPRSLSMEPCSLCVFEGYQPGGWEMSVTNGKMSLEMPHHREPSRTYSKSPDRLEGRHRPVEQAHQHQADGESVRPGPERLKSFHEMSVLKCVRVQLPISRFMNQVRSPYFWNNLKTTSNLSAAQIKAHNQAHVVGAAVSRQEPVAVLSQQLVPEPKSG